MTGDAGRDREPPAVTAVNEEGASPYLLICEHASNYIPARYGGLGLASGDLVRHIAWDPGAADLARQLSGLLDAPLFLSGYSRLLIDCNRPPGSPSSIPVRSEDTEIPGNRGLAPAEIAHRVAAYFTPFQKWIARVLDARSAAGRPSAILGVHSFSPIFCGARRVWHVGVLHGRATALASRLLEGFRRDPRLVVGDNEPYRIEPDEDYTVPVHGDARGIPAALIEVRNDLLVGASDIDSWASRIARILEPCDKSLVDASSR